MAVSVTSLADDLRVMVHDLAKRFPRESIGTGNGTRIAFYVLYPPIKSDSQKVYIDDVEQTEGVDYTVDDDFGRIEFASAPAVEARLTIDYTGLSLAVSDVDSLIGVGARNLVLYYKLRSFDVDGNDDIEPEPSAVEQRLILFSARLDLVASQSQSLSLEGMRVAKTGVSFDTQRRAENMNDLFEILQAQFKDLVSGCVLQAVYVTNDVVEQKW